MTEKEIRKQIIESGLRLQKENLVQGTWGNVSIRYLEDKMIITPSGIPYDTLREQDLVIVDINTLEYEGDVKPSGERKVHAAIYRERADINAIIHTHSENCSIVASARVNIPPVLDDMVQIVGVGVKTIDPEAYKKDMEKMGGEVVTADYGMPSTKKLTNATVKALRGRNACLMANHGAVCIGRNMEEAFTVQFVLEKAARTFIDASAIGCAKKLGFIDGNIQRFVFLKKYSKQSIKK